MDNKTMEEIIEDHEESTLKMCIQYNLRIEEVDAWQEELDDEWEMYNE